MKMLLHQNDTVLGRSMDNDVHCRQRRQRELRQRHESPYSLNAIQLLTFTIILITMQHQCNVVTLVSGYVVSIRQSRLLTSFDFLRNNVITATTTATATTRRNSNNRYTLFALYASTKKNSKKNTVSTTVSRRGFGIPTTIVTTTTSSSTTPGSTSNNNKFIFEIDRSTPVRNFYNYMEQNCKDKIQEKIITDNWKRTVLGNCIFTTTTKTTTTSSSEEDTNNIDVTKSVADNNIKLRGVIATQDIVKGSDIISIPYELAINLGFEGDDPTIPAIQFLKNYLLVMNSNTNVDNNKKKDMISSIRTYYELLPDLYTSNDCYGSTDFFPITILNEIQFPSIMEETIQRKQRIQEQFNKLQQENENVVSSNTKLMWNSTIPLSIEHLQWATWIITSRVLTVQGNTNEQQYKLLIPYLDMCNHDRTSTNILTGRATSGGLLKIVAGSNIQSGSQIVIPYGNGNECNNRFIQDYGFLDTTHPDSYTSIAHVLLQRTSIGNSTSTSTSRRFGSVTRKSSTLASLSIAECERHIQSLQQTTIEYDELLLKSKTCTDNEQMKLAVQFRLGVKKALQQLSEQQQQQ